MGKAKNEAIRKKNWKLPTDVLVNYMMGGVCDFISNTFRKEGKIGVQVTTRVSHAVGCSSRRLEERDRSVP